MQMQELTRPMVFFEAVEKNPISFKEIQQKLTKNTDSNAKLHFAFPYHGKNTSFFFKKQKTNRIYWKNLISKLKKCL